MQWLNDFFTLIYPRNCLACKNLLFKHEDFICNYCYLNLPKSNFHKHENSELDKIFYGRVPIMKAASYYVFEKSGNVQQLLHHIKYKGNKNLARQLGNWYAHSLNEAGDFSKSHFIIPVPLHPRKLKQRGFNQSEEFAKGLSEAWNIPLVNTNLIRTDFTSTQTKKRKFERWENVKDKFDLSEPEALNNKTVILVDDVITTGATIDACYQALSKAEGIKINVLSLAYAKKD
jgi:competence protein ComFC